MKCQHCNAEGMTNAPDGDIRFDNTYYKVVRRTELDRLQALADLVPGLLEILEIAMGKMCGSCSRVADSKGNHPCDVCEHIEWNKTIAEARRLGGLT